MKRLFILGLTATALLAGCSNDEVLEVLAPQEPQEIGFANPFLDKNTRADLSTSTLGKFYVYGEHSTNTKVFDGALVEKKDGSWTCGTPAYWQNGKEYYFAAYSNGEDAVDGASYSESTNTLTIPYTNDGAKDLIYATAGPYTGKVGGNSTVEFTFGHALAKVYFSFTNSLGNDLTIDVSSITLKSVKNTGDYNGSWTNVKGTNNYGFGSFTSISASQASNELYMIPQEGTYTASFSITVKSGDNTVITKAFSASVGANWSAGNVYSYSATIDSSVIDGVEPIKFSASVTGWGNTTDGTITPSAGS